MRKSTLWEFRAPDGSCQIDKNVFFSALRVQRGIAPALLLFPSILKKGRGRHLTHDMSNAIYNKSRFYEFLSLVLPRRLQAFASDAVGFSAQGSRKIDKAKNYDCSTVLVHLLCSLSVYRFRTQKIFVCTTLAFVNVVWTAFVSLLRISHARSST